MASGRQPLSGSAARPGVGDAMARVAEVGPYFVLRTGAIADGAGFRPLVELYDRAAPDAWAARVEYVRGRLRTDEPRVAASILYLGVASRLWSVALGAAVLGRVVPDLDPVRTHWRFPASGAIELWAPDPIPTPVLANRAGIDRVYAAVMTAHLVPLARATRAVVPIAERLLAGNAASALVGAARVLHRHPAPDEPELVTTTRSFADGLLATGLLRGSGLHGALGAFRRTTCCLYYRIPGGGTCGDCVFHDKPPQPTRVRIGSSARGRDGAH
ncbi:(2Fe-2S)-binding protein [Embleya sp. NPDC020886]|uniref:(2Fe-2S)-binding protein n=1 Tax=Embleya sp. NPDC020886 TaxID=3363980 RepID=UPI0037907F3E